MKIVKTVVIGLGLSVALGACSNMSTTQQRTLSGAGIGAAGGALVGELATGRPLEGAAIGTAVGAMSGWLYDRHERNE